MSTKTHTHLVQCSLLGCPKVLPPDEAKWEAHVPNRLPYCSEQHRRVARVRREALDALHRDLLGFYEDGEL
jgi:hypothetical protein